MPWKPNPFVPHGPAGPRRGQRDALAASALRMQQSLGNRRSLDVLIPQPDPQPPLPLPPPATVEPGPARRNWFPIAIALAVFALLVFTLWKASGS